jgi:hypothetical protein
MAGAVKQTVTAEVITPEQARIYLDYATDMSHFRRPSKEIVEKYAADIKAGKWGTNGDAIHFMENGMLINGLRRLLAVIKAGVPVEMIVVRYLEDNEMPMDRNAPPTGKQLARIDQLMDDPALERSMDEMDEERWDRLISTRGGAGVLINWMKNKIKKADSVVRYLSAALGEVA